MSKLIESKIKRDLERYSPFLILPLMIKMNSIPILIFFATLSWAQNEMIHVYSYGDPLVLYGGWLTVDKAPYHVLILKDDRAHCSGSIFDDRRVLTSAEYVHDHDGSRLENRRLTVIVGANKTSDKDILNHNNVEGIDVHGAYEPYRKSHDFAILRVRDTLFMENAQKIALANRQYVGAPTWLTGYAKLEMSQMLGVLNSVFLGPATASKEKCIDPELIDDVAVICIGFFYIDWRSIGKNRGAPLMALGEDGRLAQIGILSHRGVYDQNKGYNIVFSNVMRAKGMARQDMRKLLLEAELRNQD